MTSTVHSTCSSRPKTLPGAWGVQHVDWEARRAAAPSPRSVASRRNRLRTAGFSRERASGGPRSRPERTSCSSARRHSAVYCFVPDCERVRVNDGATPTVPQGRPRGRGANPLLTPREGVHAESARRPGKRGLQGRAPRARCWRGRRATVETPCWANTRSLRSPRVSPASSFLRCWLRLARGALRSIDVPKAGPHVSVETHCRLAGSG
jgi:hypothetical protein